MNGDTSKSLKINENNDMQNKSFNGPPEVSLEKHVLLRSAEFRKEREKNWQQLNNILERLDKKGLKSLSANEVKSLPLLHRNALSSLSVARNIVLDRNLLLYLEDLSLRSYLAVYGPRIGLFKSFVGFFTSSLPKAVRRIRWHILVAFMLFMLGVLAGYLIVNNDINYFYSFVPESLAEGRGPESTADELRDEELFAPWPGYVNTFIVFANALFRHNTIVGLLAFGFCFAFGIPSIFLLVNNGLIIGAFIALHADKGLAFDFIAWLSIHGLTEILAICFCGGAGLAVAEKLIFPGRFSRLDSLANHGKNAAMVMLGAVALFFIAGIFEGGFRQLINHSLFRYAFAAMSGVGWFYYFALCGREEASAITA